MQYQVKRGYSYVDRKTSRVSQAGVTLDPSMEVDSTQLWKLEPSTIVSSPEKVGMVTKDLGQQEPSKEPHATQAEETKTWKEELPSKLNDGKKKSRSELEDVQTY